MKLVFIAFKHATLRSKSKDWLTQNQVTVSHSWVDHYVYLLRLVDPESGQGVSLLSGPLCLPTETGWPRIRSMCLTLEWTIMSTYWDWLTQNQVNVSHSWVDHYVYLLRLVDTESGQGVSLLSGPLCLPTETGWHRIRSMCLALEWTIMSTCWDWLTQNQVKVSRSWGGPLCLPTETGWPRIRSRCLTLWVDHYVYLLRLVDTESGQGVWLLSGSLCLPADCCFSELAL
jgi:hypothetical protein